MEEQAKGTVPVEDDWPTVEPGYGMPCFADPRQVGHKSMEAAPPPAPRPAPAPRPLAEARSRPFPCSGRPDHFPAMFARSALFSGQRQPRKSPPVLRQAKLRGQMHYNEM